MGPLPALPVPALVAALVFLVAGCIAAHTRADPCWDLREREYTQIGKIISQKGRDELHADKRSTNNMNDGWRIRMIL